MNIKERKEFIHSKTDLKEFLSIEKQNYGIKSNWTHLICISEKSYLWKHNVLLRKTEYYVNNNKKIRSLIYKVLLYRYQNKHHIHIPINVFDRGLRLMHLGPILVNRKVVGGKNIALHINTSLVAGGTDDEAPTLEDGVVIGVGAVVLGSVRLARNIAVGANAVVNKSFAEENITIAGVPAKMVSTSGRLGWNKKRGK
ncbi:serine acetyltransferase [Paenibacillus sp. FSL R10-2734]|uniref:serine acetyltransferase n=1 Tax=Paenibacillus sp. FSL R10-2734 TaxID=2954691 RepID=UPI0030D96678